MVLTIDPFGWRQTSNWCPVIWKFPKQAVSCNRTWRGSSNSDRSLFSDMVSDSSPLLSVSFIQICKQHNNLLNTLLTLGLAFPSPETLAPPLREQYWKRKELLRNDAAERRDQPTRREAGWCSQNANCEVAGLFAPTF